MEYQVITPEGVEYLKSVTAPDRVFYGDEIEYDYAHDEMPDFGTHAPDVDRKSTRLNSSHSV